MEVNRWAAVGLVNAILWYQFSFPLHLLALLTLAFLLYVGRDSIQVLRKTWRRDVLGFRIFFKVQGELRRRIRANKPIHRIFSEEIVRSHPRKVALLSVPENEKQERRQYTFQELDELSNQVGNVFAPGSGGHGLAEKDVVGVLMANSPEYVGAWLGLSKVGIVSALINTNQKMSSLAHSLKAAACKALIMDPEFEDTLVEAQAAGLIAEELPVYVWGEGMLRSAHNLPALLAKASKSPPSYKPNDSFRSTLFYVYTSGTTGLPKPAIISNARYYFMAFGVHASFQLFSSDRLYITMPLYHSAAGILGSGQVLIRGCSAAIRKKFSASRFWSDAVEAEATVSQYIGEIARYLMAQPFRDAERSHRIRCMFGNGMRPAIWADFVKRFHIQRIGEFYGSTEGNSSIINIDNKVGKVGFFPVFGASLIQRIYPVSLVKVDDETGEIVRGRDGLCRRAGPGECGEMVGRVVKGDPIKDFQGYTDSKDTEKKLIRDVFRRGDVCFASGDILAQDELGYLTFKDRTGDTFRWKGENVSTAEVEVAVQKALGLGDATVYGVSIPGEDGKCGMAGVVPTNGKDLDLVALKKELDSHLPPYARPVFIRVLTKVNMTGTYKLRKTDYQREGFDLGKVGDDPLYFLCSQTRSYQPITPAIYNDILHGKVKF